MTTAWTLPAPVRPVDNTVKIWADQQQGVSLVTVALNPSDIMVGGNALLKTGGTMTGALILAGARFGSVTGATTSDLSKHIDLWGGQYGLNVTSNRLNLVTPAGNVTVVNNSIDVATVTATGLNATVIGATTPAAATFTTLAASGTLSGAGFTARFAAPGPIGSTTPSTGAFTTLVSGLAAFGAGTTPVLTARQSANGADTLLFQRFTEASPSGSLLRYVKADNTANLALIDIAGNATFAGLTGTPISGGTINATPVGATTPAAGTFTSGTFTAGAHFGSTITATTGDLSKHLDLYGGAWGIGMTSARLNLVTPSGSVTFVNNGVDVASVTSTGLNAAVIGATTPAAATFTTAAATTGLVVGTNAAAAALTLNGPVNFRSLVLQTAGVNRWALYANNTAEAGANAGSNVELWGYSDAGAAVVRPLFINRATGLVTINTGVAISGASTIDAAVIGGTTPAAATFTTLSVSGTVSGAGITALHAAPGPIGSTTPSTGSFTTLSASGTVSGAGITALHAAPGPIGSTTPSSGAFTTLSASGTLSGAGATFTGSVTLGSNTAVNASIVYNGGVGFTRGGNFQTAGLSRWWWGASPAAEGGSNAGSDYFIDRYNDAGTFLSNALTITRSTGTLSAPSGITNTPISGSTGSFTTLSASGTVSGAGITALHAAPGPIGSTTPSTGSFTTLSASSNVSLGSGASGNNFWNVGGSGSFVGSNVWWNGSAYTLVGANYAWMLHSDSVAGSVLSCSVFPTGLAGATVSQVAAWSVAASGAMTVNQSLTVAGALSVSGAVSGAGITALLAAPGPIGSTTPSTGSFTTLSASGTVSGAGITTLLAPYAFLASPTFTGVPAAPTAAPGTSTTQIATTAFVGAAVTASGVSSFNTRAGAVTLSGADITSAGGALLSGATFTGSVTASGATTGWSASNWGKALVLSTTGGANNPALAISDVTGANWWGIGNLGASGLRFAQMPALADTTTAPTILMTLTTSTVAISGVLNTSGLVSTRSNGGTGAALIAQGAGNATVAWYDTTAAADVKKYDMLANAGTLHFRILNDAESVSNDWLTVGRSGSTPGAVTMVGSSITLNPTNSVSLAATTISVAGALVVTGAAPTGTGITALLAPYAPLASPSFTGTAAHGTNAAAGVITLNGPNNGQPSLRQRTAGVDRFVVYHGGTETGSGNTGSNWIINAYDDTGAFLFSPVQITRSNGLVTLNKGAAISGGASTIDGAVIGGTTPAAGAFTTLSASGTVSGAGITALLAPYAPLASPTFTGTATLPTVNIDGGTIDATVIGGTTPTTGSFVALSASGTVSGIGFVNRFSAPGQIGSTTPSTGTFTILNATSGNVFGDVGRNLLHNGLDRVQQRGAGPFTVASYLSDRWLNITGTAGGTRSVSLVALSDAARTAIGDEEASTGLQYVFTGGSGAGDQDVLTQRIENVRRTAGKTITVSFWAIAAAGSPKIGVALQQNFGSGGSPSAIVFVAAQVVTIVAAWARYSVTFTVPSIAGKTLGTTASTDFLQLDLWLSNGSNFTSFSGGVGVQSGTFTLFGRQLEIGSSATALDKPDLGLEWGNCQRFFAAGTVFLAGYGTTGMQMGYYQNFPVRMRAAPTVAASGGLTNFSGLSSSQVSVLGFVPNGSVTTTGAALFNTNYTATADL